MLQHEIDLAFAQDLPTQLPNGLVLGVVTEQENPADALVVHAKASR